MGESKIWRYFNYSIKTCYMCPSCDRSTVAPVIRVKFFNSEYSIDSSYGPLHEIDNKYKYTHPLESGLSYKLKANKIVQLAKSLEDLIAQVKRQWKVKRFNNEVKDMKRLSEKIQTDYNGKFNRVFDVERFTILCDNDTKLQDKDFFEKQSKIHHRFHNIKLYVPKHDVYVEMQATLKQFATLEKYTGFIYPKLSHEHIRSWKPNNTEEEDIKQESDITLTKIIIYLFTPGYAKDKDKEMTTMEKEKVKEKEQTIHVVLYEYYKQNVSVGGNPYAVTFFF
ncbi:hypothetical protein RFI_01597 [Reticulomyxa filosa]|uniref:Uncharacterized protein n=1 Tax=Reticulomyxa filosa TaxID=46433 RepID=X6PCS6_RETFI|nr:hypothetical protein RFI_01597 [Reticulomyxa filosa]|eukprot:ETO35467.1 hypothetical protein RFI_01597 [Reticulomyxa filosa]